MAAWTSMLVGFAVSVGLPTENGIVQVSGDCAVPAATCAVPTVTCAAPLSCAVPRVGCAAPATCAVPATCAAPAMNAGCCGPVGGCCDGNGCWDDCWGGKCKKICWLKFHSTCDMIPHYAYFPENHGYYYFRPYNYIHFDEARRTVPGRDPKFPFSTQIIDDFEKSAGPERTLADNAHTDLVRPRRQNNLTLIEEVLNTK